MSVIKKVKVLMFGAALMAFQPAVALDWREFANFARYSEANEQLLERVKISDRIVFMGDSITEGWSHFDPKMFQGTGFVNRGIGGQTTPQMLLRFRSDVIALDPDAVVVLAGINDIAGNTGFASVEEVAGNVIAMAELAAANDITVLLCSVLPASDFPWSPGLEPAPKVKALNHLIKAYAEEEGHRYVDYYSATVDDEGGLRVPQFTSADDLVHPNIAGYKVMEALVRPAIISALLE